jgi:predicted outer membrane repeat protein
MERQKADAVYHIDCYGYGESTETVGGHDPGDKLAALQSQHAVMLVRNFLMSSINTYLQLRGLVWGRWPMSINQFDPERGVDGAQKIVASRIAFSVDFNEYSPQYVPVNLNYVAIDVHRAEDGLLYFEHDFDYTKIEATAPTLQIGGAASLVRSLNLVATAPTLQIGGEATLVPAGEQIVGVAPALQIGGAATLQRDLLLTAEAANLQIGGAATLPRALVLSSVAANLQIGGAATLVAEDTIQAVAPALQIGGAAELIKAKILTAEAPTIQVGGTANLQQNITATAPSLQIGGAAELIKASILQADAASLQVGGAATLPRDLLLTAEAASLQIGGAATLPRALLLTAIAPALQIDGAANLPRDLLLTAIAPTLEIGGTASLVSEDTIEATAASLQIGGAATLPRALKITATAASLQIGGTATLEQPVTKWFVDPAAGSNGTGVSWTDPFDNIPSAVTAASSGEEIWVKEGSLAITSAITLKANVDTYGGFASTLTGTAGTISGRDLVNDITTIDANSSSRILTCVTNTYLDGFTLQEGTSAAGGGVAYIDTLTSVEFVNCKFNSNTATSSTNGGAFLIDDSTVTFTDCNFTSNSAYRGGAIYADSTTLTMDTVVFTTNSATNRAGALYHVTSGTLTTTDVDFTSNTCSADFGAFYIGVNATMTRSDFTTNAANSGSGTGGAGRFASSNSKTITLNDCNFNNNNGNNGQACQIDYPTIFNRCKFYGHTGDHNLLYTSFGYAGTTQYNECEFYNNDINKIFYLNTDNQITNITNCVINDNDLFSFEPSIVWNRRSNCNIKNTTIAANDLGTGYVIDLDNGALATGRRHIWRNRHGNCDLQRHR